MSDKFDFDVKVAVIPENYSDLDDYINKRPEKSANLIADPVPIYDFYLVSALKKFDKETAYGKKRIVEYLSPILSS